MTVLPTPESIAERCNGDGEFSLAARGWSGGIRLTSGDEVSGVAVADGVASAAVPEAGPGVIELDVPADAWSALTAAVPPPFLNDLTPAAFGPVRRTSDDLIWWQYGAAAQRAIELLRPATAPSVTGNPVAHGTIEASVGRYVHLDLDGITHRVYFEEAGSGIPLLLQHTAGSHGVQWRHLLETPAVTDHFRLIAYDLPYHGKSLPPVGQRWWESPYQLTGAFVRSVPLALADALGLDDPVFMGCSVGGLLALDLALHAPEAFRAVISLEGSLYISGTTEDLWGLWHPQVSNEAKARMMQGLTAPQSPIEYVKETTMAYSAGWPPTFLGDLHYYVEEFDLRDRASEIDTSQVGVHILSGEYDWNAPPTAGRRAHEAIAGSTYAEMPAMGHFPMSENPEAFLEHVLPVLDSIRATGAE